MSPPPLSATEAVVLGTIQGMTALLPISSEGHLALAQMFYGREPDVALTTLLHLGTLAATVLVLRTRVARMLEEGVRGLVRPSLLRETPGGRDAVAVALAAVPTALVGLLLERRVQAWSNEPLVIGACLLLSGAAIASTRFARGGDAAGPSHAGALIVGLAQGAAVMPGLSRTAMTLTVLLWLGVRAERAFELCFLVSLPAVTGALIVESRGALAGVTNVGALAAALGMAFVVGAATLVALRRIVVDGKVAFFALYLVPLALATLAWGWARP